MIKKIKGTQDFLNLDLLYFIINKSSSYLKQHNFSQIKLPILEQTDLFKRAVGSDTDIVSKEMFTIAPREGSKESICLRPEATASTTRAFLENGIQDLPWKVFSYGPMFRYERPQKGRFRQFHQCNIEIIAAESVDQDVLLIKLLDNLFKDGLKIFDYGLAINFLGCFDDRKNYREVLKTFLKKQSGICQTCNTRIDNNTLRVFDCKNYDCQTVYEDAPKVTEHLCTNCNDEYSSLQKHLEMLGVSFIAQPKLVRGLDYYNKTVFEFFSNDLGAQNTFCGGGRYELATQLGNKKEIPSIGAAMGLERLMLLLEPNKNSLPIPKKPALSVIIPLTKEQNILGLLIAQELFNKNICSDVLLENNSVKSKLRKANKMGAAYCILIGEEEQKQNLVTIKNMQNSDEMKVKQSEIVNYLK